jgi:hypothetical protein
MISNVLSAAIAQIKRYRLEFDAFPTDWPEMDDLVSRMDQMRAKLNSSDETNHRIMSGRKPTNYRKFVRPSPSPLLINKHPSTVEVAHEQGTCERCSR